MKPIPKDLKVYLSENRPPDMALTDDSGRAIVMIEFQDLELTKGEREAIGKVVSATITKLQENRERR